MPIRVLIAAYHTLLRAALRALLDTDPAIEVVAEAENTCMVFKHIASVHPHVLLLDINLSDMQGFENVRRLSQTWPDLHILLLSDYIDSNLVRDALIAGAAGCVLSQAAETTLITAIQTVAQGHLYAQPSMVRTLLTELYPTPLWPELQVSDLTDGEKSIVRMIAQGCTNRQVAQELALNLQTVTSQREEIMLKLGLHNRTELMRYVSLRQLG